MARVVLIALAVIALLGWGFGCVWITGMACAFGEPGNQPCGLRMPWHLNGGDFAALVVLPGALVLILFGLAWRAGRRVQKSAS